MVQEARASCPWWLVIVGRMPMPQEGVDRAVPARFRVGYCDGDIAMHLFSVVFLAAAAEMGLPISGPEDGAGRRGAFGLGGRGGGGGW